MAAVARARRAAGSRLHGEPREVQSNVVLGSVLPKADDADDHERKQEAGR